MLPFIFYNFIALKITIVCYSMCYSMCQVLHLHLQNLWTMCYFCRNSCNLYFSFTNREHCIVLLHLSYYFYSILSRNAIMYFFCKMVQQISNMIKYWSELSASTELCMTLQMDLLAGSPTESFNEAKVLMDFWLVFHSKHSKRVCQR